MKPKANGCFLIGRGELRFLTHCGFKKGEKNNNKNSAEPSSVSLPVVKHSSAQQSSDNQNRKRAEWHDEARERNNKTCEGWGGGR